MVGGAAKPKASVLTAWRWLGKVEGVAPAAL